MSKADFVAPTSVFQRLGIRGLSRHHVGVLDASLAGHQQAQFPHSLSTLPRLRSWTLALLLLAIAMLLVEFLLAALTLLLKALDDVNRPTRRSINVFDTIACSSIKS